MARGKQDTESTIAIEAGVLAKAMKHAAGIVATRHTLPILGNVRLAADGDTIEIVTTDLDVEFRQRLPLRQSGELATTVDARRLAAMVQLVDHGAPIAFRLDGGRLTVSSGRSRMILPALPAEDFPQIPADELAASVEMGAEALAVALARTTPFISNEPTKYYLGGVLIEPEGGKLRMVATDAFRMMILTTQADWPQDACAAILGNKFCQALKGLASEGDGTVRLSWDERKVRAEIGTVTLIGKTIDGTFPEYRRIIPADGTPTVIDPKGLLAALRRIDLVGERKDRLIRVDRGDGLLTITARTEVGSEATEEVVGEVGGDHPSGFNSQFLGTLAEAIGGDSIEIHQADAGSPAMLRRVVPDGAIGVLWPVRI